MASINAIVQRCLVKVWTRERDAAPATQRLLRSGMRSTVAPALVTLALALSPLACAQQPSPAKPAAPAASADPKADGSYSLGVSIGNQLRSLGLNKDSVSMDRVSAGLRDALSGTATASQEHIEKVNALIEQGRSQQATGNKAAAQKFLADNGKKKGVVTTQSGLQYRVVAPGAGNVPKPADEVTVHYRGTLLDGTEFDSSIRRGQPATFPVNGVIQGWQEALVLMKPGAKYELFIPPELAYGANSEPPIPPNSLLKFDVELLSIKPAAAAAPPPAPKK
jgi:FKBP-type peptidyl-prolyl cis-trans isomerase FklB